MVAQLCGPSIPLSTGEFTPTDCATMGCVAMLLAHRIADRMSRFGDFQPIAAQDANVRFGAKGSRRLLIPNQPPAKA